MKPHLSLTLVALLATFSLLAAAANDADHAEHHPEAAASQKAIQATRGPQPASAAKMDMQKMDTQMKAMQAIQAMHEKMMQAKTPEERQALMGEHMKVMHNGMSMMSGMMGKAVSGKESMSPETMQKQMDMMQMMMDMMKERMQASPMK